MRKAWPVLLFAIVPSLHAAADPAATVDAFHAALRAGQTEMALHTLAPDVSIYQQGFVESSREAYRKDQLKSDTAFAKVTEYEVLDRRLQWLGDNAALVLSHTRTHGEFSGEKLDLIGDETALLRKSGDSWVITHLHWSAHPADQGQ